MHASMHAQMHAEMHAQVHAQMHAQMHAQTHAPLSSPMLLAGSAAQLEGGSSGHRDVCRDAPRARPQSPRWRERPPGRGRGAVLLEVGGHYEVTRGAGDVQRYGRCEAEAEAKQLAGACHGVAALPIVCTSAMAPMLGAQ